MLEMEKNIFSEIPNFSYMRFFTKCSMFRRSIPLNMFPKNTQNKLRQTKKD